MALCLKDLGLVDDVCNGVGADLVMTAAAHSVFRDAAKRCGTGFGQLHVAK